MQLAIDLDAVRTTIINAIRDVTGLPQNQVVSAQPESADTPVPPMPFFTVQPMSTMRLGMPAHTLDGTNLVDTRSLDVSFNVFADTHEEAMGLMTTWQAALGNAHTREMLALGGLAMWSSEAVRDLSEKLDTGFQPRAYTQVTFGVVSSIADARDEIDSATIVGPGGAFTT